VVAYLLFAAFLVGAAVLLVRHSERNWRIVRDREDDQIERTYYVRRRWRRLGISALIALIGFVIPLSKFIGSVLIAEGYLLGLVVAVFWILALAVVDMIATQAFFRRETKRFGSAREKLELELKRARAGKQDDNGKPE